MTPSFPTFLPPAARRAAAAFSLVEVTLALAITVFGLVGIVGVLPTALTSSRQSYDRNRIDAVADTLFGSFRGQPFQSVCYLDAQFDGTSGQPLTNPVPSALDPNPPAPLNLNQLTTASTVTPFYATFLEGSAADDQTSTALGDQRHIRFASQAAKGTAYLVQMTFNNQPNGTVIVPSSQPFVPAQANQIELIISPVSRPSDKCRFVSIVANRTN